MNVDDLYGTLYVPQDGTMDPAGTCTTLTRAATTRGAQVLPAPLPRLSAYLCGALPTSSLGSPVEQVRAPNYFPHVKGLCFKCHAAENLENRAGHGAGHIVAFYLFWV